jgi:hypothetical protein
MQKGVDDVISPGSDSSLRRLGSQPFGEAPNLPLPRYHLRKTRFNDTAGVPRLSEIQQAETFIVSDRTSGGGSKARTTVAAVAIRDPALMPPPDAKPEYHALTAFITSIDSDQSMYYMAAPDTGRKVRSRSRTPALLTFLQTHFDPLQTPKTFVQHLQRMLRTLQ